MTLPADGELRSGLRLMRRTLEVRVEQALSRVLQGRTAIVIAHRMRTAVTADRVVVMDGGRVTAIGPHAALAATDPGYARLVEVWERGILR